MKLVLVVDDSETIRSIVAKIVGHNGHMPVLACNGLMGLDILDANPHIDLIITDIMMPRLDGKGMIEFIAGSEKLRNIPIIVMSAGKKHEDLKTTVQDAVCIEVREKPLDIPALGEQIQRLLSDKQKD